MTNSSWVAEQLAGYQPEQDGLCAYERVTRQLMLHHAATQPRAFWRDCFTPGHFTASMLVTNLTHSKVLLMHHKKLQHWLQFGGHADGEENLLAACRRNLDLTLLVLNNFNFGMTGGQYSATTPPEPPRSINLTVLPLIRCFVCAIQ